jgi:hypothetical protein
VVASANRGVLGCFRDESVDDESVDDDREGDRLRAAGRLLSSWGDMLICVVVEAGKETTVTRSIWQD